MAKPNQPNEVTLVAVRLSFPQLFVAKSVNGGEPSYGCSLLMEKESDAEQITACKNAMKFVAAEKWGAKLPGLTADKLALRDGGAADKVEVDGYGPAIMYVSAGSKKPPLVVDKNRTPLDRETGAKVYAGCYVNAKVRFWAQDNQWGKRINCQLVAVQFVMDGDAFGEAPVRADEVFDDVEDDTAANPFGETPSTDAGTEGNLLG